MELKFQARDAKKKTDTKKLRREGKIPAIIYSKGDIGLTINIDAIDFKKVLNSIKPGSLASTIFVLNEGTKKIKAIVKDIQYNITTYDVIHLDFIELIENIPVTLNVPIDLTNTAECIGVKGGGVLRQTVRYLKVRCLPKDIPSHFELDVKDVGMYEKRRLSDIVLPEAVEARVGLKTIAATVGKR